MVVHVFVFASVPSLAKGQLSCALVELGKRKRLTATPKFIMPGGQELGYRFGVDTLQEFMPDKETKAKLICKVYELTKLSRHETSKPD